jgi:GntR family transcriptional repressor for pyruvate dehydrogenase complex
MPFQEIIPKKTKAMHVAEQIIAAIKQGEYSVGNQLPPERLLAEQMKVSRNSVREALSALQIIGIIETRTGEGTYVKSSVHAGADIGHALLTLKEGKDLFEIWEARKEIESSLIRLAIERINPEKLENIRDVINDMHERTKAKDSIGYLVANNRFHMAVAEAADNIPLKNALSALMKITTEQLSERINIGYVLESIEKSLHEHEDIYSALEKQDEQAAVKAIRIHFEELEGYFRKRYRLSRR